MAVQDASPHIVGAVSFRRFGETMHSIMVHVLPQYRRQNIGSALLRQLLDEAHEEGDRHAAALVNVEAEPQTELFLLANGFVRGERLYSVEGDLEPVRAMIYASRDRLVASDRIPLKVRIVPLSSHYWKSVLQLYTDHIARNPVINTDFLELTLSPEKLSLSGVLLVEDSVEGMILCELDRMIVKSHALVVSPKYRKSWAVILLLAEAMELSLNAGARRFQFDFLESNLAMLSTAHHFQTKTTKILATFVHNITPHETQTSAK